MPVIQLDIDASGCVRGIKQYEQATRQGAEATDQLSEATKAAEKATREAAAAAARAASEEKKRQDGIKSVIAALSEEAATYGKSRGDIAAYQLALKGATQAQIDEARAIAKTIDELEKADKKHKAAEPSLGGLAKKALAVGAAYVTVASGIEQVSKATKLFVGFDDALRVASSYAGVLDETSQEFNALKESAKAAGATTSASTLTAAQALGELTSAGLSVKEANEALIPTIRLSESAQADLAKSAAVSTGIMLGFGKSVGDLPRINDIITAASGISKFSLESFGDAAKDAVPAARAAGISIEDMTAIMGVMVDQQIPATTTGNAFRTMLLRLVKPTDEASRTLAQMGINVEVSQGKILNIFGVLEQLKEKNTDLGQASAIFGTDYATAILAASNAVEKAKKNTDFLKTSIDGLNEKAAKFQQGGLGGAFRELESAVEAVYIAVGEQLAPIIKEAAEYLTGYAGEAKKSAELSTLIVSGVKVAAVSLLALKGTAQTTAIAFSYLYEGYVRTAEALRKPFDTGDALSNIALEIEAKGKFDKNIEDIKAGREAMSQSLQGTFGDTEKLISQFDRWEQGILDTAAAKQATAEADKDMQTAAEAAGIAAGKAAASQGKSFTEAAAAAEAGKKSYLEQAKAAEQKQAADAKSATDATTAKTALEEQAEATKQLALSFGYSAAQAQAEADNILRVGKAAAGVSSAGVDNLNTGLDKTTVKAQAAGAALSGIGGGVAPEAPSGGIVSFTADLDLSPYQQKVSELKQDIDNFKANYHTFQLKFDGPPEFSEARKQLGELETAYSKAQAELEKQQGFDDLNQKLKETRSELSQTRQAFADGKLVIDTDPATTAALQEQEAALVNARIAAGALGNEFQVVNGVITNIYSPAQQARDAFEGMTDTSGRIITEWRQIDGVWTEVLPNGEKLVDAMNKKMAEGVTAAGEFGGAVAAAGGQIASGSAEADKIIASLTGSVEEAAAKAGTLKFDELKNSTTALEVVRTQIKSLEKDIETFGITSKEGQAAVAGILKLEEVESSAQDKIKALHDEIYGTGEEARKTTAAVNEISAATSTASAAVSDLAAANNALAETAAGVKSAGEAINEFGKIQTGTFTFSGGKSIEEMTNDELSKYIEAQKNIADALKSQADMSKNNVRFAADSTSLLDRTKIVDSYYDKYFEAQMEKLKRAANTFVSGIEGSAKITAGLSSPARETGAGIAESTTQQATYNFYGYDRSDAEDIVMRANRAERRS